MLSRREFGKRTFLSALAALVGFKTGQDVASDPEKVMITPVKTLQEFSPMDNVIKIPVGKAMQGGSLVRIGADGKAYPCDFADFQYDHCFVGVSLIDAKKDGVVSVKVSGVL